MFKNQPLRLGSFKDVHSANTVSEQSYLNHPTSTTKFTMLYYAQTNGSPLGMVPQFQFQRMGSEIVLAFADRVHCTSLHSG